MEIVVTSAHQLSSAQTEMIIEAYAKKLSLKPGQINIVAKVDPKVIGGLRVAVGSKQIDHTIARKLDELKKQLIKMKV